MVRQALPTSDHPAGPPSLQGKHHRFRCMQIIRERLEHLDGGAIHGTKIIGTPDAVRAELDGLARRTGVDELMIVTTAHDVSTKIATLEAVLN